jgi:NADPH:quinone reductase-like Zn-dependent oxidoreductase
LTVNAIVYTRYGAPDVLQFRDTPTPTPRENEVLLKVHAASINPLDFHHMRGHVRLITGVRGPRHNVLGCDIAGRVEAVGRLVKEFRPGDDVFGVKGLSGGGFAEYACAGEQKLALKPANISYEEAAAVPVAGVTALQGLRDKGRIRPGDKVLIDGASGGVGTFAVQIAKSFGAEVTAVCSTRHVDTARSIGVDRVIDYTREDFTQMGQRYDLIFGANACRPLNDYMRVLNRNGTFVGAGGKGGLQNLLLILLGSILPGRKKIRTFIARISKAELDYMKGLIEAGKVRPVIDRRYPMSETAAAIRYLEEGHANGKVVLTTA